MARQARAQHQVGGAARYPAIGVVAILAGQLQRGGTEHQIHVLADPAGGLELDAAGFHVHAGVVELAVVVVAGTGGQVVLLGLEHRQRGQQSLVQPVGLHADLVVGALGRVEIALVLVGLALRLVDVRIADIAQHMRVEIEGEAGVGAGVAFGLVEHHAVVHAIAMVLRVVRAHDGLQAVGQRQPGGAEGALQALVQGAVERSAAPLRLGDDVAAPRKTGHLDVTEQIAVIDRVGVLVAAGLALGPADAEHHFLIAPAHLEMAVGGQRAQVRGHLVLAAPRIAVQAQVGARFQPGAGVVGGVEQLVVVLHLAIVVGRLQLPVRAQLVGVFGERVLLGGVPVGPVLGGGGAAIPLGLRAVAVHEGQRAPHVAVGLALLPGIAEGERAVLTDLAIDDAVQEITLVLLGAQPGVSLFMRGDNAPCPAAIGGERRRVIGFGAHRGPGTVAQSERALALVGGALAHVVDGAGGIAHAGQQAIGAADDFQLLVAERVHGTGDDAPVVGQADAIDLRVGDVEAARGEGGPVGFPLVHLDAGGQAQRFIEAVGAELAHLGGVHDADGLRRVLDVQVQVGGAVAHAVGALRDHQHGVQIGGGVAGDRRDGGGFLGRSQGGRRQRGQGQANRRAEAVGGGRGTETEERGRRGGTHGG